MDACSSESAFLVSAGLLLLFCLYQALSGASRQQILSWLGSSAQGVLSYVRSLKREESVDLISRHVMNKMRERQQETMQSLLTVARWATSSVLLLTFWNVLMHSKHWHSAEQDFLACIGTLFASVSSIPCVGRSPRSVYACHAFIMLLSSLWVQLSEATPAMVSWSVVSMVVVRLAMSSTYVNVEAVVFWNFICSSADLWKFTASSIVTETVNVDLHTFLLLEATICFLAILSSTWLRADSLEQFRREGVWRSHDLEHSASRALLEHFCEVSVPLDSNFQITSDAKRFAAMLTLDASETQKTVDIQKFMSSEDDRAMFRDTFSRSGAETTRGVCSVTVFMRDGNGSKICCEVVGVAFATLDNTTRYVIGIRECSDFQSAPIGEIGKMRIRPTKTSLYKGTPSRHESKSLEKHPDEIDAYGADQHVRSSITTPTLGMKCLAKPHLLETSSEARQLTLIQMMLSWNVSNSRSACCAFHACLPTVKRTLESLRRMPCQPCFHAADVDQCRKCALLDSLDDEDRCTSCGFLNRRMRL